MQFCTYNLTYSDCIYIDHFHILVCQPVGYLWKIKWNEMKWNEMKHFSPVINYINLFPAGIYKIKIYCYKLDHFLWLCYPCSMLMRSNYLFSFFINLQLLSCIFMLLKLLSQLYQLTDTVVYFLWHTFVAFCHVLRHTLRVSFRAFVIFS
jgi:hypothetical protein